MSQKVIKHSRGGSNERGSRRAGQHSGGGAGVICGCRGWSPAMNRELTIAVAARRAARISDADEAQAVLDKATRSLGSNVWPAVDGYSAERLVDGYSAERLGKQRRSPRTDPAALAVNAAMSVISITWSSCAGLAKTAAGGAAASSSRTDSSPRLELTHGKSQTPARVCRAFDVPNECGPANTAAAEVTPAQCSATSHDVGCWLSSINIGKRRDGRDDVVAARHLSQRRQLVLWG